MKIKSLLGLSFQIFTISFSKISNPADTIQFLYANAEASDVVKDRILHQNEGVTFKLFSDEQTHATCPYIVDETPDGLPKHISIEEVVRNKDMHYYQVPRLGSFLAIKLEYVTCLFEEAFDAAVKNYTDINEKIKE